MAGGAMVQSPAMGRENAILRNFQHRLLDWFRANHRDLPWRRTRNPYRIWISEIMLQQTRTVAVLPYYRRFFRLFPSLRALAAARTEAVLRAWAGLGYYSRARNLHRAAQIMVHQHGGRFPHSMESVLALPGIGEYTARAVLSIAYGKPVAVLDGNVARVIGRREILEGDLRAPSRWKHLQAIADRWLAIEAPGDWNQAMMELGATICTPRNPNCSQCPVRVGCGAFKLGLADRLPEPRQKQAAVRLRLAVAVLLDERGKTILVKPPKATEEDQANAIFSRMWQFPAVAFSQDAGTELRRHLSNFILLDGSGTWKPLSHLRHTVTFREITLEPWLVNVSSLPRTSLSRIVALDRVPQMAVSSATRKIARAALASQAEWHSNAI